MGAGAKPANRGQGAGYQASASTQTVAASISRSSRRPIHPPVSALSARENGSAPKRACMESRSTKFGASAPGSSRRRWSRSPGDSTSGMGDSVSSGLSRGPANVARARAISLPSCSRRAVALVSPRPERSITGLTVTAPSPGGRRNCTVSDRA